MPWVVPGALSASLRRPSLDLVAGRTRPTFDRLTEGRPQLLIRNGVVDYRAMRRESVTHNELLIALREHECFSPHQAAYAVLETDGTISVCKMETRQ